MNPGGRRKCGSLNLGQPSTHVGMKKEAREEKREVEAPSAGIVASVGMATGVSVGREEVGKVLSTME